MVFLLLSLSVSPVWGQQLRQAFDRLDQNSNQWQSLSKTSNAKGAFTWRESYWMRSYLIMYRATGEVGYLQKFIRQAGLVLSRRDDRTGVKDHYRQRIAPTWASSKYSNGKPYAWVSGSGMITFPMADFAQMVIKDSALHALQVDSSDRHFGGQRFDQVAHHIVAEVEKTIAAHDQDWMELGNDVGGYRQDSSSIAFQNKIGCLPGHPEPLNRQNAMGRTLLMMYLATGNSEYLDKARKLANNLKSCLKVDPVTGAYTFRYWGLAPMCQADREEDISHGSISVDFAYLCYKNDLVFDRNDMERFSKTFLLNLYQGPLQIANHLDGSMYPGQKPNKWIDQIGRWLALSQFNPDIYSVVLDHFAPVILETKSVTSGAVMQAVAGLNYYRHGYEISRLDREKARPTQFQGANLMANGKFAVYDNGQGRVLEVDQLEAHPLGGTTVIPGPGFLVKQAPLHSNENWVLSSGMPDLHLIPNSQDPFPFPKSLNTGMRGKWMDGLLLDEGQEGSEMVLLHENGGLYHWERLNGDWFLANIDFGLAPYSPTRIEVYSHNPDEGLKLLVLSSEFGAGLWEKKAGWHPLDKWISVNSWTQGQVCDLDGDGNPEIALQHASNGNFYIFSQQALKWHTQSVLTFPPHHQDGAWLFQSKEGRSEVFSARNAVGDFMWMNLIKNAGRKNGPKREFGSGLKPSGASEAVESIGKGRKKAEPLLPRYDAIQNKLIVPNRGYETSKLIMVLTDHTHQFWFASSAGDVDIENDLVEFPLQLDQGVYWLRISQEDGQQVVLPVIWGY